MMANDTNYQLFAWWVSTASIICTTILLYTVSRYLVVLLPIPKKKTTIALIIIKIVVALFAIGSVVTILLVSDVQPIIVMNITFSYHFFAASSLMVILGIAAFHYKKFAKGWEQESLLEGITATFLPLLFTFPIDLIFFREQTFKIAYLSYSSFVVYLYFFISRQYFQQYEHPIEQGVIDDKFLKQKGISIREKEVLLLLIRGKTSFEIGTELFISHNTVKTHIKHIYEKLQVSTRVQLYALIAQHTSQ
jgi:DNA-binding CsgD family transcriptional regulator